MVSKSTSRKRRHTKSRLQRRSQVRLIQIDRQRDCWLLSELLSKSSARHTDLRGTPQAVSALRRLINSI